MLQTLEDGWGNQFFIGYDFLPFILPHQMRSGMLKPPLCADGVAVFQMLHADDYAWEIEGVSEEDSIAIELGAGLNELVLYDQNGCEFSYNIDVEHPAPLQAMVMVNGARLFWGV